MRGFFIMKTLRVGLAGAGGAARFHIVCLRRAYGVQVELAGVTSLRAESRERFGREHGIPVYAYVEAMLEHVDVLDICSPPYAHEDGHPARPPRPARASSARSR